MKTKLKAFFAVAAIAMALPAVAQAQFTYTTDNGTITITGYTGSGGDVTIPSTISGLPVTTIGDYTFYNCGSLTNVTIPNSVTNIGDYEFYACYNLTSVTIGNGVTTIGDYAFAYCGNLTSVTIGNGVTTIGDGAFYQCESVASVTIGNGVTNIGNSVFLNCRSLTAFIVAAQNSHYSTVNGVLFNQTQTMLVQYPDGLSGSYSIPNSVTNIGNYAFSGCGLTSVTIPGSVTTIGNNAFSGCGSMTAFIVAPQNSHYSTVNGVLFNQTQTTLVQYPGGLTGSYTIPNGVTSIGDYAFSYDDNLTSVTIPGSVTAIGDYAFAGCDSLTSVTIPGSVTNIGDDAFFNCHSLTSVYFNGNAPGFGDSLFVIVYPFGDFGAIYTEIATVYYMPGTSGWSSTFAGAPTVMLLPPPPTLSIIPSGANVILTWPTNVAGFDYSGFTVQSTTNLADTNSWTALTNLPVIVGSQSQVTDAISGPAKFYRLKK
ncbi:MAG TPA: leucine-rich repeat domain-containing protein [Verrucomicrobiae bacterium]